MPQNRNSSLFSVQPWQQMTQSIATAVCNVTAAAYGRLHLEAVSKRVLPEHTHDALFQLFCDLRTNTPKDKVFLRRHAKALQPHTVAGWLAMFAALLYSTAGLALTAVGLLGVMAATAFASILFAVIGGIMFASFIGVVATTLVFASFGLVAVTSSAATAAAAGFVTLSFWRGVFRRVGLVRERISQTNTYTSDSHQPSPAAGRQQTRFNPVYAVALGENTGEATHDKLTTEPAQEPFKKAEDEDVNSLFGTPQSVSAQTGPQGGSTEAATDTPFASAFQNKPNKQVAPEATGKDKPSSSKSSSDTAEGQLNLGSAQTGSAQSGSAQSGSAFSASGKSGSTQGGSAQSGSAQSGSAQSGSAQSGSADGSFTNNESRQSDTTDNFNLKQGTNDRGLNTLFDAGKSKSAADSSGAMSLYTSDNTSAGDGPTEQARHVDKAKQPALTQDQGTNDQDLDTLLDAGKPKSAASSSGAMSLYTSDNTSAGDRTTEQTRHDDTAKQPALTQDQASGDQDLNTISGPKTPASQPAYAPEGSQGASSGHTDTGLSQRQQDSDRSTEADVTERSQGAGRVGEPVFTQRQQDTSDEGNGHFLEEGCHAYQSKGEQDHAYQPEKEHGAHLGGYDDRHHNRHSQGDSDADAKRAFPGEAPVFIDAHDTMEGEQFGQGASQIEPTISEPSSSPTFAAADSGLGGEEEEFFEHSAAPSGLGAFDKTASGALPRDTRPGTHSAGAFQAERAFSNNVKPGASRSQGRSDRHSAPRPPPPPGNLFQEPHDFPGVGHHGRQDIGLQSNFMGPAGSQGPVGSMGPRGQPRSPY